MIFTPYQILIGRPSREEWDEQRMWHVWETTEACTGFRLGDPRQTDHLENTGVRWEEKLKWIFKKWDGEALTGLSCPRIGSGGRLL